MVVNCLTKYNGVFYPAGSNVPAGDTVTKIKTEEKPVEVKVEVEEEIADTTETAFRKGRRKRKE